jgi:bis(5'-adenosyl)-triphosphatase
LTAHSFAFVNLKPILPGHVLVSPLRRVSRLRDLSPGEVADLFVCVQSVSRMLERVYHATALNVAVQDGPDAGQSVPHLHAHIIPRKIADLPRTDDVYAKLDGPAGDLGSQLRIRAGAVEDEEEKRLEKGETRRNSSLTVDADEARKPRSEDEMVKEAEWLAREMKKQ